MIYIFSGSAEFRIGDHFYQVCEGDNLFVNSGELHSAYCNNPTGCGYYAIVFNLSFLSSSMNDVCQSRYISPFMLKTCRFPHMIPDRSPIRENLNTGILELAGKLESKAPGFELFVKGGLLVILSLLIGGNLLVGNKERSLPAQKSRVDKIKKVIDFISDNYSKKVSIKEMALLTGMNKYNFCRFFKNYAGITPLEYLNMHRINEACRLLESTRCNITEAALQVGFDNMSYFAKIFRKYKNITPSRYKQGDFQNSDPQLQI